MEQFQQIDWTANLEDIVDEQFLNEERLKNESAMYSIMNGNFQDPFQHLRRFAYENPSAKQPPGKQQAKEFTNKPGLGVAVAGNMKKRGRPKKIKDNN